MVDILMRKMFVLLALASVAGCADGASAVPSASNRSATVVTKIIQIDVPAPSKTGARAPDYVSRNTQGIGISFGTSPFTFPANTTPTAAFDVSSLSSLCTAGTNGARTCTLAVGAPVGTDDFQVTAWNNPPVSGGFAGDTALSTASLLGQAIASGASTPLTFTLNGIVDSVAMSVSPASLPAHATGSSTTATLSVVALDRYGNVILGSGYYADVNGNPLSITVVQNAPPKGGPVVTTVPSAPVSPTASTLTVTYPGGDTWGTSFLPNVAGHTIPGTTTGVTMSVTPILTEFTVPTTFSYNSEIASGPDGNLWFTENNSGANKIGKMTTSGGFTEYPITTTNAQAYWIVAGPDNNMWFTENAASKIGVMSTAGAFVTDYATTTATSHPYGITSGPDGNLWFTENSGNNIGKITTSGVVTEYPILTSASSPQAITSGPDGNLWFVENAGNKIGKITTTGAITEYPIPTTASAPIGITAGPDGNLWFTESSGNKIGQITTAGVITEFSIPTLSSYPTEITAGSDGALWFSEGSGNNIGRISTSGALLEFPTITASSNPIGITKGPDGSLWFTENGANKNGRLIY